MSIKLNTLTNIDRDFGELSATNFDGYTLAEAEEITEDLMDLRSKVLAAESDSEVLAVTKGAYLTV